MKICSKIDWWDDVLAWLRMIIQIRLDL